ncbi:MAG TPA: PAS domain-containing sensor histidine kinase, partial [Candidatus Obscuribacterales bacterium]|nr:PAS domain-containing sensor histidine kinase [Candidatus Obscuribacterales bacterium]
RPFTDFVAEADRERLQRVLLEAKQQKETAMSVDIRMVRNDLSEGWMLWSIYWSPPDESYYCVAHDISDRKELDQMKADFVNMVSHDLRTPLTGMRAFLDSLSAGVYGELNKKGTQASTRIQSSLGRLVNLVNDLLDVEKMEAGRMEMRFGTYSLKYLVDQSLDMVKSFADEQKVQIEVGDIVEADVLADIDRMVQVLQNLLANAIKFSPKGGIVTITTELEPGAVKVNVTDHGAGIAEADIAHIFDRFRQVAPSKTGVKGGTGLGLAICKAILEQHNGSVGVESQVGEGSTFWFRIPGAQKPEKTT